MLCTFKQMKKGFCILRVNRMRQYIGSWLLNKITGEAGIILENCSKFYNVYVNFSGLLRLV